MFFRNFSFFAKSFLLIGLTICFTSLIRAENSQKIAAEIMKSTVRVVTIGQSNQVSHGTGFIISDRGHIATNTHVIEGGARHFIVYSDGRRVRIRQAEIVAVSGNADLSILWCLPVEGAIPVRLATEEMAVGQNVSAVGFPGAIDTSHSWATLEGVIEDPNDGDGLIIDAEAKSDFQPAVFPGSVAKLATLNGVRNIFHSAKISPGNSGGPLIDAYGRVCGINTSFIPAGNAGADYPMAIDSRELIHLAKTNFISIEVSNSKNPESNSNDGTMIFLWILFVIIIIFILLRYFRKKSLLNGALSSVFVSSLPNRSYSLGSSVHSKKNANINRQEQFKLSGKDAQGMPYAFSYHLSDVRKSGGRLLIGRKNVSGQLCIFHPSISLQHAVLSMNSGNFYLQDLHSANGTEVNGNRLHAQSTPVLIQHGYLIRFGEIEFVFEIF